MSSTNITTWAKVQTLQRWTNSAPAKQWKLEFSVRDGIQIANYAGKIVEFEASMGKNTDPGEAVIWEEVEARLGVESRLTGSFVAMMTVAVLLGGVAVLTDSLVLVVGAMVVGPEFGPLAAATLSLHRRRWAAAGTALRTMVIGFVVATSAAVVMTLLLRAVGRIPDAYDTGRLQFTAFISHPDLFTVIVAVLAGAAGMLALTQGKSGSLVGVLISVTTIPAASNVGVATALGRWSEVGGAAAQLGANLACMVSVGLVTLAVERRIGADV